MCKTRTRRGPEVNDEPGEDDRERGEVEPERLVVEEEEAEQQPVEVGREQRLRGAASAGLHGAHGRTGAHEVVVCRRGEPVQQRRDGVKNEHRCTAISAACRVDAHD
jgi:hypothetical protein